MQERNSGLDCVKCLAAFCVVCIHVSFPGIMGDIVSLLSRFAVPVFFMITGYYYSNTRDKGKVKKQIVKVTVLLLLSMLLYFIWSCLLMYLKHKNVLFYCV